MKKKNTLILIALIIIILFVVYIFVNRPGFHHNSLDFWVGEYSFEEYIPPNIGRMYFITIYEDDGLYAHIKVDGFQTLLRLKTKVVSNENEILFVFINYYEEDDVFNSITFNEDDVLLKFQKQNDELITSWGKLQPIITENEESGQYFIKSIK